MLALALYLALLFSLLQSFGFNPTGPVRIGAEFDGRRFWTESTIVQPGVGYDGQFFYYLAHDPLLTAEDPHSFLDHPAYRYGRVLYPLLAWTAALGRAEAIAWALLAVNLAAVLVGTAASALLLRSIGARPSLALAFALSPALVLGVIADLAEPTAFALVAVGFALHLYKQHRAAGLALAFATLAREASAVVTIGFALHAATRRAWREAAAYLLPLSLPLAWHLWVWARLGSLPMLEAPANFGLPLSGVVYRIGVLLGWRPSLVDELPTANPLPELLVIGLSLAIIVAGLARVARRRDVFSIQLGLQAAMALCTTPLVWVGLGSYGRVLGLLYLFYGLALLSERARNRS